MKRNDSTKAYFGINLTETLNVLVREDARRLGISVSQYIRNILYKYYKIDDMKDD